MVKLHRLNDRPSLSAGVAHFPGLGKFLVDQEIIRNQLMKNQYHHKIDVCLMPGPVSINEEFSELVHWGDKFPMLYWTSQTNKSDYFRG